MSNPIKLYTIYSINGTIAFPFTNVPASPNETFVTEIIRVVWTNNPGGTNSGPLLYRGDSATVTPSNLISSPYLDANTNGVQNFQHDFYFDGRGLLVPENTLSLSSTNVVYCQIQYRMTKIPNKELYLLMVNQGAAKDLT